MSIVLRSIAAVGALVFFLSVTACAVKESDTGYRLDNAGSSLNFVSVKAADIAEAHTFDSLSGRIDEDGLATLTIDIDSVNTGLEIRDDRMKEFLFDMAAFPEVNVTVQINPATFASIDNGGTQSVEVAAKLDFMGNETELPASLLVTKSGGTIVVTTAKPIILSASNLGLNDGLAKLAELAGGISISKAVPVSFSLRFAKS